ncbi:uncharacterized protein LOC117894276 [Drosophila subobscura]|uniref:uncharacterized protein LOC117894276 n=1 Tax=Drosophila subobscura TaxID=7241 RepID=UPI00155A799C|nr:uncharacterized protein LOC117894276 [Drosophila subobscura]
MQKYFALLAFAALLLASVSAQKCNECQSSNDAKCVSQTKYQNCMNNVAIGAEASCPTGTVCSNTADVCVKSESVDGTTILDVCGSGSGSSAGNGENCAVCLGSSKFACVSKTEFARCVDQKVSTTAFSCATDETCVTEALALYGNLCVPSCAFAFIGLTADNITCTNTVYTPPTAPAVPTQDELKLACSDAGASNTNPFFDLDNAADTTCSSYIYCEKLSTSSWLAILYSCKSPTPYYSQVDNKCIATKPTRCTTSST